MDYRNFHGYYVFPDGEVRSKTIAGHNMASRKDKDGYPRVNLQIDGKKRTLRVHKIVANCYLENPENHPHVHHKDFDKTNNCIENLEWCSAEYNNANKRPKNES